MFKKWLAMGGIFTSITPVITVVSCGAEIVNGISWNRQDRILSFNLNGTQAQGSNFAAYFLSSNLTKDELITLSNDFDVAIVQNNVLHLKKDDVITLNFTGSFVYDEPPANNNGANGVSVSVKVNYVYKIKYKFGESTVTINKAGSPEDSVGQIQYRIFKTNFIEKMLEGLKKGAGSSPTSFLATGNGTTGHELLTGVIDNTGAISLIDDNALKIEAEKIWDGKTTAHGEDVRSVEFPLVDLTN